MRRTPLHLHSSHHADLFEDFTRTHLAPDEIYVPPHHQPVNPEDEDDVVPDQHAAFGITRAMGRDREAAWRDLGLEDLVRRRPEEGPAGRSTGGPAASATTSVGQNRTADNVGLTLRMRRDAEARSGRVNAGVDVSRTEGLPR